MTRKRIAAKEYEKLSGEKLLRYKREYEREKESLNKSLTNRTATQHVCPNGKFFCSKDPCKTSCNGEDEMGYVLRRRLKKKSRQISSLQQTNQVNNNEEREGEIAQQKISSVKPKGKKRNRFSRTVLSMKERGEKKREEGDN